MKAIDTGLHYPIDLKALPTSWVTAYIEDYSLEVESGFACGQHNSEGHGVTHLRPMNVSRNGHIDLTDFRSVPIDFNEKRLKEDDVLFNNTNSPELIGKTAHVTKMFNGLAFSNHMTRIKFHPLVVPKFSALQLHYLWMMKYFLHRCVKHVNQASISTKDMARTIPFILPPFNEQKRIVAKIEELFSELDSGIAALKIAQEQLKVYRQAVLKHAFEGKLTAKWREENKYKLESPEQLLARIQKERENRYQQQLEDWKVSVKIWEENGKEGKKPSKPKELKNFGFLQDEMKKKLPELPTLWFWQKMAYITTGVEYGTSAKSADTGLVPVIRMGNLQNGKIDWSDLVYTSDTVEIEKYALKANDVLFNRTNSPELVGKTSKYKGEYPALFAGYLIRINQIESIALPDYINYFLNSHIAKHYGNSVKTDGVNQSNINGEKLQNYPFPFCSIAEQTIIVKILEEKLSLTDATIQDIELELSKAEALRQSILKKAFSGQLVPQYPTDEPASELLARIKVEKAAQDSKAKPKVNKRVTTSKSATKLEASKK